jgi:hypothetical protein
LEPIIDLNKLDIWNARQDPTSNTLCFSQSNMLHDPMRDTIHDSGPDVL